MGRATGGGFDVDVVVVGSGFGGSVSALRLVEKGYSVTVLEAGRRFESKDLPKNSWDLRNFLWAPALGLKGIQRIQPLNDAMVMAGAGVGGGSLNYANTLYEPLDGFYDDPHWSHITDWRDELAPFYDQAKRMLGVNTYPLDTDQDRIIRQLAGEMGVADTFTRTPVGVFFGTPGQTVEDPYFGGAGPDRTGCLHCGQCMTGCRHGAKNMLIHNYLYLAEQAGAVIEPESTVVSVRPMVRGGYLLDVKKTGSVRMRHRRMIRARQVVFSAGSLGTAKLLHRMKAGGILPGISDRLGRLTRTNSEALLGAVRTYEDWKADPDRFDTTRGVAITSSIHPDERTHIEPVRYGKGSNSMALMTTIATDGGSDEPRWRQWLSAAAKPGRLRESFEPRNWSERLVILLVMQDLNNSLTSSWRKGPLGGHLVTEQGEGEPNPTYLPAAEEARTKLADIIDGITAGTWNELFNIPMTAHYIGGCVIGDSPQTGVIDPYQRLYGYEGLHVVDGSALSANLGVNPSLSITAQAERAMSFWPNRGEVDTRAPLGSAYRRVAAVEPKNPVVPEHATGALRLPLDVVSR